MIFIYVGDHHFGPDPIGGRTIDSTPYTGGQVLSAVNEWPDITKGETYVQWPSLFRQLRSFIINGLN